MQFSTDNRLARLFRCLLQKEGYHELGTHRAFGANKTLLADTINAHIYSSVLHLASFIFAANVRFVTSGFHLIANA
jgi:hypothetical protein